jgi:hypothetical protein
MPVPPPSGKKHNYSTVVQPEDSFPTHPKLARYGPGPPTVANSATAASRCSSDNELPLNMKLLVGCLQGRVVKVLSMQPGVVGIGPGLPSGVDQAVAQQEL